MKFAFSADWHLSAYSQDDVEKESGLSKTLFEIVNTLKYIVNYCLKNSIKTIVVGGDLLHGKSIIHAVAQGCLLDFFRSYNDIHFIVIDGNHDLSSKGKRVVSALKSIDKEPNVTRIEKYKKDGDILYVPYSIDMIDIIKNNSSKYLISHFGLSEGQLNSGISIISDISIKDLQGKYEEVYLGHYHKPQEIIRNDIKLYYVGSPIQLDWGEKHEEKRFLVIDTDKRTVESIHTEGYTKYFSIPININNKDSVLQEIKKLKNEGHLVRLEKMDEVNLEDLSSDFNIIDRVDKDITNRGINNEMNDRDKLIRYLEIMKIPKDDHEKYLSVALNIKESCIEL